MRRVGKRSIHQSFVADGPFVAMVVWRDIVQRSGSFCLGHVDDCGQHVVIDFNQFSGIFCLLDGFGNHHRHVVAHITHLALRKDRVRWLFHRAAVGAGNAPAAWQAVDLVCGNISAHKHVEYARRGLGSLDVDALDVCVRVWRPHKHGVALVGQRDVVGVLAAAR